MMFYRILIFIFFLCLGVSSFAGLLIEPSIGVQGVTGSTPFSYQYGLTQYKYNQQSYPIGLAVTFKGEHGLLLGLMGEYYSSGYLTAQTTNQFGQDSFTRTIARAIVGFESSRGFRAFAGYDFMNNINNTPAANNTNDFTALNNTGYAVGVGWRFHRHFAFNAIYDMPSGSPTSVTPKNSGTTTGTFTSNTYNSFLTSGIWNLNVSFPFGSESK